MLHCVFSCQPNCKLCYIIVLKRAKSNEIYFDFTSLTIRDNLAFFQFSEQLSTHFDLVLESALFAFKETRKRHVRHVLNRQTKQTRNSSGDEIPNMTFLR